MNRWRITGATLAIASINLFALGCASSADFRPVRLLDPFPPITVFPVVPASQADAELTDAELVLGVTIEGESRAYPINMLTGPRREILNDTLAGHAICATW